MTKRYLLIDIEADSLTPTNIWVVVTKDIQNGEVRTWFSNNGFRDYISGYTLVGHNILWFDIPVLNVLWNAHIDPERCIDTLVFSRLFNSWDYSRHSLGDWGERLGLPKGNFSDWSKLSEEMIEYCKQDVEVEHKLFDFFKPYIEHERYRRAYEIEHRAAIICREMHYNGFGFDIDGCNSLYDTITKELSFLTEKVREAFPSKQVLTKTILPIPTKSGSINRKDFRWITDGRSPEDHGAKVGVPYHLYDTIEFNPSSPKQCIERLNELGWSPVEKTKGHIKAERELRYARGKERKDLLDKLEEYKVTGWTISEENLETIPDVDHIEKWVNNGWVSTNLSIINDGTRKTESLLGPNNETITKITLNSTETDNLRKTSELLSMNIEKCLVNKTDAALFVNDTIQNSPEILQSIIVTPTGTFVDFSALGVTGALVGLRGTKEQLEAISKNKGAKLLVRHILLTRRLTTLDEWKLHYNERTKRIHGEVRAIGTWTHRAAHKNPNTGNIARVSSEFGSEMRSLWRAGQGYRQIGCDAEGIQLRILAHYMDDEQFTRALVSGRSEDGTDVHTLNWKKLNGNTEVCKDRTTAKTFIYSYLLGAGVGKTAQIFSCTEGEAREARDRFQNSFPGLGRIKNELIPSDARRGWFEGLDGRPVMCDSEHLMLAGYLQNGESIVMKHANWKWRNDLKRDKLQVYQMAYVHDEWQVRFQDKYPEDVQIHIGKTMADAITWAGIDLGVKCPLAGSFKIGKDWADCH